MGRISVEMNVIARDVMQSRGSTGVALRGRKELESREDLSRLSGLLIMFEAMG
jgi:hypothetical protein